MYQLMVTQSVLSRPKLSQIEGEWDCSHDDGFIRLMSPPVPVHHTFPSPVTNFITEALVGGPVDDVIPEVETIQAMIFLDDFVDDANPLGNPIEFPLSISFAGSVFLTLIKDIGWTDVYDRIKSARSEAEWVTMTAFKARPEHYSRALIEFWLNLVDRMTVVPREMTIAFAKILRLTRFDHDSFMNALLPTDQFIIRYNGVPRWNDDLDDESWCLVANARFLGYIVSSRILQYRNGFQSRPEISQVMEMYAEKCGVFITESTFLD
jgi:hypothetical protein